MRRAAEIPVSYVAFDLLYHAGRSLLDVPYAERRERLAGLAMPEEVARAPRHHVGQGAALLEASRAQGLEGLVIGAWRPGSGGRTGALGALLVGHYADGGLRYAGRVGTGFTGAELSRIRDRLRDLARESSPFAAEPALPA